MGAGLSTSGGTAVGGATNGVTGDSFLEQYSRTRRFSLGRPRTFTISEDGGTVAFLRSRSGSDPLTCLWLLDVATAEERLVVDPAEVLAAGNEELSPEERARRERARETAGGVVAYSVDRAFRRAAVPLGGRLFVIDLESGDRSELATTPPVFDPRLDPLGGRVAYVSNGALRVADVGDAASDRMLAAEDDPNVTWGMAEHVAAEEMERLRGFWWSPDGEALAAARVDNTTVRRWFISDPASPDAAPFEMAYAAAGTDNADVGLHVLALDGSRVEVEWDRRAFPYLVNVTWSEGAGLTLLVQSRAQKEWRVLRADPATGATTEVWRDVDEVWLDIVGGVPAWTDSGSLVMAVDREGARRVAVDGEPVTPPELQVRRIVDVGERIVFQGSERDRPDEVHVWTVGVDGSGLERMTEAVGVHVATSSGGTTVIESASIEAPGARVAVVREGAEVARIESHAEAPDMRPDVTFIAAGPRQVRTALLLPTDAAPDARLPVLLDPYGGPHFQRVTRSLNMYLESQWWADQGFAVVVADGRGTPGRGTDWEKAVHLNYADPVLEDQVDALRAVAAEHPQLDLSRVAIRGWSFGGFLAALAVLRRPDVFHAAVAGAPVTDQRLYDTHYTERYLGHPDEHPEAYDRCSLLADAPNLRRPLLLIHGMADDNVVVAHTLRMSQALLEAGRPHRILPITGVTHMTPTLERHLLRIQLEFLREALGLDAAAH